MSARARVATLASLVCLWGAAASAQVADGPYISDDGRLALAGDVSTTVSPPDASAFFNFTDYDHDALRTVRVRLIGQWRPASRLSVLGELRFENLDRVAAAAFFVRWRPWQRQNFDIQAGRIPPVIGVFARQAYGRDNLVIGTPLAYQYLTSLRPDALPATADDLLRMRARGWRPSFPVGSQVTAAGTPLVTAFKWDTGVQAHWHGGALDLAGAVTRGAPAVSVVHGAHDGPGVSGRAALTPVPGLTLGVSGARGHWIDDNVLADVPAVSRAHTVQSLVGADAEFGVGRVLIRTEWIRSAFDVPIIAAPEPSVPLVANAAFVEGRYRFHPRWQASARLERLIFSDVRGTLNNGAATPWDAPVTRMEAVVGYRAARNIEIRTGWQQNWRAAGRVPDRGYPALQVLYWF